MQPLISLCMIVKNEESVILRCLESVKDIVDEYCILDTGSTDNTIELIENFTGSPVVRGTFRNFVDTKNEALQLATGKYILWMDADEILCSACKDKLKKYADNNTQSVILNKMESDLSYYKYRLWPNLPNILFKGPYTHEYLSYEIGNVFDNSIKVFEEPGKQKDWVGKFNRDINLITKYLKEVDENDPRALFYIAQSYNGLGSITSIHYYKKYLEVANFPDEIYWTYYQIASIYNNISEIQNALYYINKGIQEFPKRAELFYLKGMIYYNQQDWENCLDAFLQIKDLEPPDIIGFLDRSKYNKNNINDYISFCYHKLRKYVDANEFVNKININEYKINLNKLLFKNRSKLKIAMYMGPFVTSIYGGMLDYEGIYGTETAYLELAESFVQHDIEVYLFTETPSDHTYKSVKYIHYSKFEDYKKLIDFDVVINSRNDVFNVDDPFIKVMWVHDLFLNDDLPNYKFDILICSTEWHKSFLLNKFKDKLKSENIFIVPLSINMNHYKNINFDNKDITKITYTSALDRGLLNYLPNFDKLLSKNDSFKIHYYYGNDLTKLTNYNTFSQIERQMSEFHKMYPNNLINHGRLNKKDLAKEKMLGSFALYPVNFLETFCITLLENQLSGLLSFTSRRAAIYNTLNPDNNIIYEGWIGDEPIYSLINYKLNYYYNNPLELRELQIKNREFAIDYFKPWSEISKQWLNILYKLKYLGQD